MPPHRSGQSRDSLLNGSRDTSYIGNDTFNRVGPSPRVVTPMTATPLLDRISSVDDLRRLSEGDLQNLASELRTATIGAVSKTGGHLGAGLGVVGAHAAGTFDSQPRGASDRASAGSRW